MKKPLGRLKHKWEDNIKMFVLDLIELAWDRDRWRAIVNFSYEETTGKTRE
jgi:hypothetical protein